MLIRLSRHHPFDLLTRRVERRSSKDYPDRQCAGTHPASCWIHWGIHRTATLLVPGGATTSRQPWLTRGGLGGPASTILGGNRKTAQVASGVHRHVATSFRSWKLRSSRPQRVSMPLISLPLVHHERLQPWVTCNVSSKSSKTSPLLMTSSNAAAAVTCGGRFEP